jgi:hypothetical protein
MGSIVVNGSSLGNTLTELLEAPEIMPGDQPSYELCKTIWLYHPLGNKMVQSPIEMAQSQEREIAVPGPGEERISKQFRDEWERIGADDIILNFASVSRAYGVATLALMVDGLEPNDSIDWKKLADLKISFSVYDPLNTAGSIVLNQDPLSIDFQKVTTIAVSGKAFHRSRTVTLMHERPVYIAYTASAFGFVGRSVFQRALFPLKSYIQTMVTDDLVVKKAGVFIATLKTAGAIIDAIMQASAGLKRLFVKEATNGNVISIGPDEKIETLNMQNIDKAFGMARNDILDNIAIAGDMPAVVLKDETFVEGFGEGTEDAKKVARWVDRTRRQLSPAYRFMDNIVMRRAWNPEFFESLKADVPEYAAMTYDQAFYKWQNSFNPQWPSLLTEPDSDKVETDKVKLEAILEAVEIFGPMMDPENKATLMSWAQDNINENKMMFQSPLNLDIEAIATYEPPQPMMTPGEPAEPKPNLAKADTATARRRRMRKMDDTELLDLVHMMEKSPILGAKANGKLNGHAHTN